MPFSQLCLWSKCSSLSPSPNCAQRHNSVLLSKLEQMSSCIFHYDILKMSVRTNDRWSDGKANRFGLLSMSEILASMQYCWWLEWLHFIYLSSSIHTVCSTLSLVQLCHSCLLDLSRKSDWLSGGDPPTAQYMTVTYERIPLAAVHWLRSFKVVSIVDLVFGLFKTRLDSRLTSFHIKDKPYSCDMAVDWNWPQNVLHTALRWREAQKAIYPRLSSTS